MLRKWREYIAERASSEGRGLARERPANVRVCERAPRQGRSSQANVVVLLAEPSPPNEHHWCSPWCGHSVRRPLTLLTTALPTALYTLARLLIQRARLIPLIHLFRGFMQLSYRDNPLYCPRSAERSQSQIHCQWKFSQRLFFFRSFFTDDRTMK